MTSLIITACDNITADFAEGIVISSAENVRTIKEGETLQLTATVYPLTIDQIVVWSSSNETVATVNESGLVTAVAKGNVDIIATSSVTPEVSQKFSLVIEEAAEVEIAAESVTITADKTTCKVGEKINLSAVVAPQGANQSVTWSSADQTMATVSRGEVTALKEGTVVITVAVKNYPNVTSTITLTFEKSDDPIVNLDWAQMPYSTHEDYMTADGDAPLKVKGVVTHVTPVTETVVSYFIQNGVDGYYVYAQNNISFPVELGKSYEVGGYKKYYRGLNEIVNVEHFVELTEACTYTENAIGELDPTSLDAMNPYHCSIVTGKAAFSNGSTNTKAYSFYAMVNGKSTTFRVDPSYITAEEFEAINQKVSGAVEGLEFTFKGVMTAFGYGKASPQILVLKATDLEFAELSPQIILEAAANSLKVSSSVPFKVNTITLPTAVEGNPDITVEWSTESDLIDLSTGAVTHPNAGTEVVLKATLTLGDEEYEAEFKVYIFEQDNNEYEVVTSLDLEECGETDSYGNSLTKPGYAAGVVSIGTPANEWLLQNALISGTSADKKDGKMSIRAQAGKDAEKTGRIEIKNAGEYNVVEFDTAIYGTNALGVKVRVEYSLDNGATWVAHDAVITIDHYTLETYRFKLPEGVKHVAIVVVENTGNRINFDNIKLMK
jgi:hypothetical protein